MVSASDRQVGGSHYRDAKIQPRDVAIAWGLEYEEVLILRYLCRHRRKHGARDVEKLIHSAQLLMERLYNTASRQQGRITPPEEPLVVDGDEIPGCPCASCEE